MNHMKTEFGIGIYCARTGGALTAIFIPVKIKLTIYQEDVAMLKRGCAFLFCISLLLSLTACGGTSPEAPLSTAPVQTEVFQTVETAEAPAEPTLSAEEMRIASLPETVRQAYETGIVDLALLEDLDRICTTDEAAKIVQNVIQLHYGTESQMLNMVPASEFGGLELTRHWMNLSMAFALCEQFVDSLPAGDFVEIMEALLEVTSDQFVSNFISTGDAVVMENIGGWCFWDTTESVHNLYGIPDVASDWAETLGPEMEKSVQAQAEAEGWVKWLDYGFHEHFWALAAADRITGEKIMAGDMNTPFGPREKMTVQETVETAFRLSRYLPAQAEMLAYGDLPTYDTSIIPDDLLKKETTLPEASGANLPKEWKGVMMSDLLSEDSSRPDQLIQENELQVIKDAGFNYVQVLFDFHYYHSDKRDIGCGWGDDEERGRCNETRLKELDQIIAWCMERDIHVNLACNDVVGISGRPEESCSNVKNAGTVAEQWAVLSRRYAGIPSTYLSFTMFQNQYLTTDKNYGEFFTPVVEAIRAEDPNRCIIANVHSMSFAASMAQIGVAISSMADWPEDFCMNYFNTSQYQQDTVFQNAQWPYTKGSTLYDADGAMKNRMYNNFFVAPDEYAELAKEYGVGYMVSNWDPVDGDSFSRERYADETMKNYLTDFVQTMADREYGWCYGEWSGVFGIACAWPTVRSATYTQIDNLPLYIDNEMFGWFQELNAVH